jgi:hypothetical protein
MSVVQGIVSFNLFQRGRYGNWGAGQLVGRPFRLSYNSASIAIPSLKATLRRYSAGLYSAGFLRF